MDTVRKQIKTYHSLLVSSFFVRDLEGQLFFQESSQERVNWMSCTAQESLRVPSDSLILLSTSSGFDIFFAKNSLVRRAPAAIFRCQLIYHPDTLLSTGASAVCAVVVTELSV